MNLSQVLWLRTCVSAAVKVLVFQTVLMCAKLRKMLTCQRFLKVFFFF